MTPPFFGPSTAATLPSLAAAFAIGIAFGWTLERAGLAQANKLANQFYLADFTVVKVMFSAILTAALGAFVLDRVGLLDLSRVSVPPTYILPQIAGGFIFGVGFVAAGLCPGTSCVAAASGRLDGIAVMLGLFAGASIVGLAFEPLVGFYETTARGAFTVPQWLGVSPAAVLVLLTCIVLAVFWLIERFEQRSAKTSGIDVSGTVVS